MNMIKYEYITVDLISYPDGNCRDADSLEDELNLYGNDGWEICAANNFRIFMIRVKKDDEVYGIK